MPRELGSPGRGWCAGQTAVPPRSALPCVFGRPAVCTEKSLRSVTETLRLVPSLAETNPQPCFSAVAAVSAAVPEKSSFVSLANEPPGVSAACAGTVWPASPPPAPPR